MSWLFASCHPNLTGSQIALDCFTEPQTEKLKPVNPKASVLPILLVGRTDAEAEAPMLWPHDALDPCSPGVTRSRT